MYKKIYIKSSQIITPPTNNNENSNNYTKAVKYSINYYIIDNGHSYVNDGSVRRKYGICVSKQYNDSEYEESIVNNITNSKDKINNLIQILCEHSVTPINLTEVIDDLNS